MEGKVKMKTICTLILGYFLALATVPPVAPKETPASIRQLVAMKAELTAQIQKLASDVAQTEHHRDATHQEVLRLSAEFYLSQNPPQKGIAQNTQTR